MAETSAAAPATLRRSAGSAAPAAAAPAAVPPASVAANWKNCRHDSSTEAGSRRYDSYISAMYPSLKTLVMADMEENLRGRGTRDEVRARARDEGEGH